MCLVVPVILILGTIYCVLHWTGAMNDGARGGLGFAIALVCTCSDLCELFQKTVAVILTAVEEDNLLKRIVAVDSEKPKEEAELKAVDAILGVSSSIERGIGLAGFALLVLLPDELQVYGVILTMVSAGTSVDDTLMSLISAFIDDVKLDIALGRSGRSNNGLIPMLLFIAQRYCPYTACCFSFASFVVSIIAIIVCWNDMTASFTREFLIAGLMTVFIGLSSIIVDVLEAADLLPSVVIHFLLFIMVQVQNVAMLLALLTLEFCHLIYVDMPEDERRDGFTAAIIFTVFLGCANVVLILCGMVFVAVRWLVDGTWEKVWIFIKKSIKNK